MFKKLESALPLTALLGWFYFVAFVFVEAFHGEFELQGRIDLATVDALMTAGTTALSVGARPWYLQLPLSLEFVLVGAMLWASRRVFDGGRHEAGEARRPSLRIAYALLLVALAVGSLWLAHQQGESAARQVRAHFAADGGGLRTLYFANGRHIVLGPVLGCDQSACSFLTRDGALVLKRELIVAEIPQQQPD